MKARLLLTSAIAMLAIGAPVHGQFGIGLGAGLVAAGDGVSQAAGDLQDFISKDSLTFTDVTGNVGFTVVGRVRYGLSRYLGLNGDASIAFFSSENVQLTSASLNPEDTSVNATFEVGTTVIPVSAGVSAGFTAGPLRPFVGADIGLTFVKRTYTFVSGNTGGVDEVEIENKSAGDPELGVALNGGADLTLGPVVLEIGFRYNMANMLSQADGEDPMRYLRIAASIIFQSGGDTE